MLLASLFVVPLSYDIAGGEGSFFNWFALCFFGLAYPVGIATVLDPRVHLLINKDEIDSIQWNAIQRTSHVVGKHSAIYLHLPYTPDEHDAREEYPESEEPYTRMHTIETDELNVDHAALYALIQQLIATDSAGREEILKTYPRGKLKRRLLPRLTRHK